MRFTSSITLTVPGYILSLEYSCDYFLMVFVLTNFPVGRPEHQVKTHHLNHKADFIVTSVCLFT
jgi:hypothetical protein